MLPTNKGLESLLRGGNQLQHDTGCVPRAAGLQVCSLCRVQRPGLAVPVLLSHTCMHLCMGVFSTHRMPCVRHNLYHACPAKGGGSDPERNTRAAVPPAHTLLLESRGETDVFGCVIK